MDKVKKQEDVKAVYVGLNGLEVVLLDIVHSEDNVIILDSPSLEKISEAERQVSLKYDLNIIDHRTIGSGGKTLYQLEKEGISSLLIDDVHSDKNVRRVYPLP